MKKAYYRHYICIAVTLAFFAVSIFVFPLAAGRIGEAARDVANSFVFYFEVLVGGESDRNVTDNDFTQIKRNVNVFGGDFQRQVTDYEKA